MVLYVIVCIFILDLPSTKVGGFLFTPSELWVQEMLCGKFVIQTPTVDPIDELVWQLPHKIDSRDGIQKFVLHINIGLTIKFWYVL
jgi:hypothetical protein